MSIKIQNKTSTVFINTKENMLTNGITSTYLVLAVTFSNLFLCEYCCFQNVVKLQFFFICSVH